MKYRCIKEFRHIPINALVTIETGLESRFGLTAIYITYNGRTTITNYTLFKHYFEEEIK